VQCSRTSQIHGSSPRPRSNERPTQRVSVVAVVRAIDLFIYVCVGLSVSVPLIFVGGSVSRAPNIIKRITPVMELQYFKSTGQDLAIAILLSFVFALNNYDELRANDERVQRSNPIHPIAASSLLP